MKNSILALLLLISTQGNTQTFISDSIMEILVDSGEADKNFSAKGKLKNDVRVGKWIDYTFEFLTTYIQTDDEVNGKFGHLLIQSIGKYSEGSKSGVWKFYAVEDKTFKKFHIADIMYDDEKREGPFTLYYASGEKAAIGTHQNDLLHGVYTSFYKTGEIAQKYQFAKDQFQGEYTNFFKSGKVKSHVFYVKDERTGDEYTYYEDGNIKRKRTFVKDLAQGSSKYFYRNGKVEEEGMYVDGVITGIKYYYESGQLWVNKEYKNGNYYNVLELYDAVGKHLDFGTLKDGNGTVKFYTIDAKVYLIRTYENGVVVNEERIEKE